MFDNRENIVILDNWSVEDLFDENFWEKKLIIPAPEYQEEFGDFLKNILNQSQNSMTDERQKKDQMIEFLWGILNPEHKVKFFESEYTIFYIWATEVPINHLVDFHDLLINKLEIPIDSFIGNHEVYKKLKLIQNQAFNDMSRYSDTKDKVLLQFYNKLSKEEVISLNTPEYIIVSGINNEKVDGLREKLIEENFKLLYKMDYVHNQKNIPVYIFQPLNKQS